jgi:hypothetical protein
MTESTFRQTLRAQPRILFWDATAAHRHAVPAAGEVLMALWHTPINLKHHSGEER